MMTKKNKLPYWKRRMLRIAQMRDTKDQEYIQKMVKEYDRLSNRIYKEIQGWMERYADNEGVTPDEAYQQLSKDEQLTWTMTLKEFRQKAIEGGYDQELNREYFKSRITRLEQLERQLYFELAEAANNQEAAMRTYLKDTLNETYLRYIYEMTDRGAFSIAFDRFSTEALELAIMKPWKGSNFSRRVWGNHLNHIPDKLSKTMSVAISQGWGIDRTVKEMMQGVDSSLKNRMTTLVQTESAHIAEIANDHSMEQTGVEKWEWLATLEIHTCARCGGLDGQEFDVNDENAPSCPDHPNCRCTRTPAIEGWKSSSRWQRDPITGKGRLGPNITFEEWKQANVNPEVERLLKIERARPTDKKQYEVYKSVIGKANMPKKFADFQDLKYNRRVEWNMLKDYKRSRKSNKISAFTSFGDFKSYNEKINKQIIGLTTSNGLVVKGQSKHFIERVFGTTEDPKTKLPRNGVEIPEIIEAIQKGAFRQSRTDSTVSEYQGKRCMVTINHQTGVLVQASPRKLKKKGLKSI